jgi:hypothetical protein
VTGASALPSDMSPRLGGTIRSATATLCAAAREPGSSRAPPDNVAAIASALAPSSKVRRVIT